MLPECRCVLRHEGVKPAASNISCSRHTDRAEQLVDRIRLHRLDKHRKAAQRAVTDRNLVARVVPILLCTSAR